MAAKTPNVENLTDNLRLLKLDQMREHFVQVAEKAAKNGWDHQAYLACLAQAEADARHDRSIQRRIRTARFPTVKTLDQFDWSWPEKIEQARVKNLFRFNFLEDKANVILLGGVGLGKTHLATALGYAACLRGKTVLFTSTIDVINSLSAAQAMNKLKAELKKYLAPSLLILDELGYLPIDKRGADLLFQIISMRYEQNSTIITTNRAFKHWPEVFNNDATLTAAMLDRLLHHASVLLIDGKSYRMKGQIDA